MSTPTRAGLLVILALAGAACAGAQPAGPSEEVVLADIDSRLRGAWVLDEFRPATPLEPMLQTFVAFQYGRLMVRLDRGRLVAESPGLHFTRMYRLHEASYDRFKLTSYDDQGVPYDAVCTFVRPDVLEVSSWTDPWRGVAMFRKAASQDIAPGTTTPPR